ncbi:hypothetical protein D9613_008071 [Agrocybe pediades]|uniref:Uncharacterized protein n=1 Tax=Agrocybe pediades TaxID=84607 RepID=A0A8H4QME5_9AGAR|nr:hypothetical protein D9613_008071 [Agrocybe pediades]
MVRIGGTSRLAVSLTTFAPAPVLSAINIIVTLTFPMMDKFIIRLSRVLYAILACRVVLDIHEIGQEFLYQASRGWNSQLPDDRPSSATYLGSILRKALFVSNL